MRVTWQFGVLLATLGFVGSCTRTTEPRQTVKRSEPGGRQSGRCVLGLAQKLLLGDGMSADRSAALALFVDGCKRGDVDSCVAVMSAPDIIDAHRAAEAALRPHCLAGNIRACRHAARGRSIFVAKNEVICREGLAYACAVSVHFNDAEAQGKVCDMGDPDACDNAGHGDAASRFTKRATELRRIGCDAGVAGDCLGRFRVDPRRFVPLCLSGDVDACKLASDDDPAVVEIIDRIACAIDAGECFALAKSRINRGDVVGARRAYETGCEATYRAGSSRAADCLEAARLSEQAPADPAAATRLRATACTLDPTSCNPKP